ncbi:YHYH protein [Celeribacter sp.]|uniref:YHYH protein n=1 Tax=Celeribacter sp. TaxID=1890673 RepID=UPI003A93D5FA
MQRIFLTAALAYSVLSAPAAFAHDDHDTHDVATYHCEAVKTSVEEAGFSDSVTVTCTDTHAIIRSDTYPDHEKMTGITGTNEQVPVPADYAAPILLEPTLGDTPLTRDAALGVAVNGVPIYDYTGGGEMTEADLAHHQAHHNTLQTGQLDACGGHAGRGDDYHYHATPVCMIELMANAGPAAVIGWAFDGFPIYGDTNPDGTPIPEGALDVCNGQPDDAFGYRYHSSADAPYIVQCLMGEVEDFDRLPRVRPLVATDGEGAAPGRPPQGGVEGLVFTESPDGTRSMDYSYEGEDYYIRYSPSETEDCYTYETRTVTNGGELHTGEYCRP